MNTVIVPLISLYNYDPSIFDGLKLPTVADLDPNMEYINNFPALSDADLRDELLMQIGELTPVYNKPDVLKHSITVWARVHKLEWLKLWQSTIYKYNPIWNKDGSYTETRSGSNSGNGSTTYGRTDTENVTGFDTNNFSPNSQNVAGGTDRSTSGGTYSETLTRKESGNIGVVTTQQMLKEERESALFNIYDHIIEAFKKRFCLLIY